MQDSFCHLPADLATQWGGAHRSRSSGSSREPLGLLHEHVSNGGLRPQTSIEYLHMYVDVYIHIHMLHYIILHCITLHFITSHYLTFPYPSLHFLTLPYITLHCLTLRSVTLRCVTLHAYLCICTYIYLSINVRAELLSALPTPSSQAAKQSQLPKTAMHTTANQLPTTTMSCM